MGISTLVSLDEYLTTMYHPDCDYVDGEVQERNIGEESHGELHSILIGIFQQNRRAWGVRVLTETRVQTLPRNFRIPDVCLVPSTRPRGRIIQQAPLLCVEVLSPEDRLARVLKRVDEFERMGVKTIWILDPEERIGYYASAGGVEPSKDGFLRVAGTPISVELAEVFAEMDEV